MREKNFHMRTISEGKIKLVRIQFLRNSKIGLKTVKMALFCNLCNFFVTVIIVGVSTFKTLKLQVTLIFKLIEIYIKGTCNWYEFEYKTQRELRNSCNVVF